MAIRIRTVLVLVCAIHYTSLVQGQSMYSSELQSGYFIGSTIIYGDSRDVTFAEKGGQVVSYGLVIGSNKLGKNIGFEVGAICLSKAQNYRFKGDPITGISRGMAEIQFKYISIPMGISLRKGMFYGKIAIAPDFLLGYKIEKNASYDQLESSGNDRRTNLSTQLYAGLFIPFKERFEMHINGNTFYTMTSSKTYVDSFEISYINYGIGLAIYYYVYR